MVQGKLHKLADPLAKLEVEADQVAEALSELECHWEYAKLILVTSKQAEILELVDFW